MGHPVEPRFDVNRDFSVLQEKLLSAGIHFFHRHIRNDDEVERRMTGNSSFRLFCETQYHAKSDLNRIFADSVRDSSPMHVCSFILSILHQGIFSVAAFVVSVIYLSRFKEASQITLHACTWRPLFLTTLLVADKMWEDKPVRNSSLAKLFPVLSNLDLNALEHNLLTEVRFNVVVKPDLFSSFCEKLLAEHVNPEIVSSVRISEYAAVLQQETTVNTNFSHAAVNNVDYSNNVGTNGHDAMASYPVDHHGRRQEPRHFTPDSRGITAAISVFCRPTIGLNMNRPFFQTSLLNNHRLHDGTDNSTGYKRPRSTDTRAASNVNSRQAAAVPPRSLSMDPLAKGQSLPCQMQQQLRQQHQHQPSNDVPSNDVTHTNPARTSFFAPKIGLLGPPLRRSLPATAKPGQYMETTQSPKDRSAQDPAYRPEHFRPSVRVGGQRAQPSHVAEQATHPSSATASGSGPEQGAAQGNSFQTPFQQAPNPHSQIPYAAMQRPAGIGLHQVMAAAPTIRSSSLPRHQAVSSQPATPSSTRPSSTRIGTGSPFANAGQKVPAQRASSAPRVGGSVGAPRVNAIGSSAGVMGKPRLHSQPQAIGVVSVRGFSPNAPKPLSSAVAGIPTAGIPQTQRRPGSPTTNLLNPSLMQGSLLSASSRGRSPGPPTGTPQARIQSPCLLTSMPPSMRANLRAFGGIGR